MSFLMACLVIFPAISFSQPFYLVSNNFQDVGRCALAWGDADNDGDLDLLLSGLGSNDQPFTAIYRNDVGTFTDMQLSLTGFKETGACWGDMDDDGDLDVIIEGNTSSGDMTRIFRNDDGTFIEIDPGMLALEGGTACWMDYDSDGDLDVFISGNWMARIYTNKGGSFEMLNQDFGYFSSCAAAWGDFDNDGDLDLLILGDSGAGAVSKIFRNDGNEFHDIEAGLTGLMAGSVDWVDYDNDGDLDATIAGNDDALEAQFYLYRNDGNNQFSLVSSGIEGFALGDADWGDYDNDGDLDLIYSGKCTGCGTAVAGIYRNEGDDVFFHITGIFPAIIRCAIQWGDYDNDGDLDFVLAGTNLSGTPQTYLYNNQAGSNTYQVNTCPTVPGGLSSNVYDDMVILNWERSTDDQTPQEGLSYNIRIGMSTEGDEVMPSMSIVSTGYRKISHLGNTGPMNSWSIENLEAGTYYWSVQAIDQCYAGSAFAPVQSFTVTATGIAAQDKEDFSIYPNPSSRQIFMKGEFQGKEFQVRISDLSGRCFVEQQLPEGNSSIDISGIQPGIYVLQIYTEDEQHTQKLVIR